MEQVSLPIRIALVAVLAIAALWFVALRPPAGEDAEPPAAPAAEAVTPAAPATPAAETVTPAAPATDAAAPATDATAPAKPTPAAEKDTGRAASERDLAAPLLRHLDRGRVVVLLFAARGADDRAAREAVDRVPRRDGRVVVRVAGIADVADYRAITTGVQVTQAPTTLVIGPGRRATAITGYTDAAEIRQAVGDALTAAK